MNSRVHLHVVKPKPAHIADVEPDRTTVAAAARIACTRLHTSLLAGGSPATAALPGLARSDFAQAASLAAVTGAGRMTMPPAWYAQMISNGSITRADIAAALRESLSSHVEWLTIDDILQHARRAEIATDVLPTIADLARLPGIDNAATFVEEAVARWVCAWSMQPSAGGRPVRLYTGWLEAHRSEGSTGIAGAAAIFERLPTDAVSLLHTAVDQLGLHLPGLANWFHRQLMTIEYVAACVPAAAASDQHDDADMLTELLAIRVAWDLCLFRLLRHHSGIEAAWIRARAVLHAGEQEDRQIALDSVLQTAYEKGWQRRFLQRLPQPLPAEAHVRPAVQAIFCIGGPTESHRRALEACSPLIQTFGVALADITPSLHAVAGQPRLSALQQCDLAESLLRQVGLHDNFAPLVLVAGHGTQPPSRRAAVTPPCGMCAGRQGSFDAQWLASLLNDADLRRRLAIRGITIPPDTLFVAAVQDVVTNTIALVNNDHVPASHADEIDGLSVWLADASATVDGSTDSDVLSAAFIAAPRAMTRNLDFGNKVLLHCYDWQKDSDASLLANIMTTTLVRATLQAMQDYRTIVANARDCVALPNKPLRLSAVLAAPAATIDTIISRHVHLRTLVSNRWLHLFAWSACGQKLLRRHPAGGWTLLRHETFVHES